MFTHATMLYLYVETPLHAGSGRGLGAIDLPIQRERTTDYPLVQASSLKGELRAEGYLLPEFQMAYNNFRDEARQNSQAVTDAELRRKAAIEIGLEAVFGPESDNADEHAGAISPGDARILLFPVRSLAGVFAWITSANILARFQRDVAATNQAALKWRVPEVPKDTALVAVNTEATSDGKVVLEEFTYIAKSDASVEAIGQWLATQALPQTGEYDYWRKKLPRSLVILPEDDFRDFARYATEVATRIRLNNETKTVDQGALWTEEALPSDALLYAPLYATKPRKGVSQVDTAEKVLKFISGMFANGAKAPRLQLGGDETVGRGLVALRFGEVKNA